MKWYNYEDEWINIEKCFYIRIWDNTRLEITTELMREGIKLSYKNKEERDAEFSKIKELMGIKDYQSRCC